MLEFPFLRLRHFMQTGNSGFANSLVQAILDDLAAHALKTIKAVIKTLPAGFPEAVADSVRRGVSQRLRLLDAGTTAEDITLQ
jgi:serine/threonine-protein kinase HipA